jgi:hypothetical protein
LTPAAGAAFISIVVALANVYAVVLTPLSWTLMSAGKKYGKVKANSLLVPFAVYVVLVVAISGYAFVGFP